MVKLLGDERGEFSLTGVLMAMVIFAGVLGATLTTFESFVRNDRRTTDRAEAQDRARQALDQLAKELRNLASPTPELPQAVDKATPYDIVFQTVDPVGPNTGLNASNTRRVRYCLDRSSPADAKLWTQSQTWTTQSPPAVPSTGSCPASGWSQQRMVADKVTNVQGGKDRPLFLFNSAVPTDISSLHVDLYVDPDAERGPAETRLTTGVFLRNQNRRPTAQFSAVPSQQGIILNGSGSSDPEGEPLSYVWYDGATKIGTGIVLSYPVPAGTSHTITLKVYDPAALEGVAPSKVVTA